MFKKYILTILTFLLIAQVHSLAEEVDVTLPDGSTYVGTFKNNVPNGKGTLTSPDGSTYVGEWKDALRSGQGTYTYADGRFYVGEWKDDLPNGQGTFTFPDGTTDVGKWKDGKFICATKPNLLYELCDDLDKVEISSESTEGVILKYLDGTIYVGGYKNALRNGKGILFPDNNRFLMGDWENNLLNGRGIDMSKYLNPNHPDEKDVVNIYLGDWKNGRIDGQGAQVTSTFSTFEPFGVSEGEFKNKKSIENGVSLSFFGARSNIINNQLADTKCTIFLNNLKDEDGEWKEHKFTIFEDPTDTGYGGLYKGDLKNGKRDGCGYFINDNGMIYEGEWKDNTMHGFGKLTWDDGEMHIGEWRNGVINGNGMRLYPNASDPTSIIRPMYYGEWKDGKRNGLGIHLWLNEALYVGEWKNEKRHGYGIMLYPDGRQFTGKWENSLPNGLGIDIFPHASTQSGTFKDGVFLEN